MPVSTAQQLPLFLAGQINKAVLCTDLGNVKCVNPILKLLYCGRHLPVPSSWPLLRGSRHSGSECSNVAPAVYRERVAYLRHMSINTTTHEHTLQIFILVINQFYAQNLFYNKFISCLCMFRAPCAHRQEVKIVLYSLWYHQMQRHEVNLL